MVLFNYATRELTAKVVYYGPGLCGKTTNLEYIHKSLPEKTKGKMLSLATQTDRTLFFDFLPLDLGTVKGMKTRIQLYTVPGQVFYDATRKLVLKGADGVVFVVDSQKEMLESNLESWENLKQNLKENSLEIESIPIVLQYNKRDLPNVMSIKDLNRKLNDVNAPHFEAVALTGEGVQETLKGISAIVLKNLSGKLVKEDRREPAAVEEEETKQAAPVAAAPVTVGAASAAGSPAAAPAQTAEAELSSDMAMTLEPLPEPLQEEPVGLEELEELEELVPDNVPPSEPPPAAAAPPATKKKSVEKTHVTKAVTQEEILAHLTSQQKKPRSGVEKHAASASGSAVAAAAQRPAASVVLPEAVAGSSQEINIPVEVNLTREGQEIKLNISIQLKLQVVQK